jgi:hypothetical protein
MTRKVWRSVQSIAAGAIQLWALVLLTAVAVGTPAPAAAATGTTAAVTTIHWKSASSEGYKLGVTLSTTLPVGFVTVSGTQLTGAVSTGATAGDSTGSLFGPVPLNARPTVADTYTVVVNYADGTAAETLFAPITAVIDSFATPTAPLGADPLTVQTFTWTAPNPLPTGFSGYSLILSGTENDGSPTTWIPAAIGTGTTSLPYLNSDPTMPATLNSGIRYNWSISARDNQGNSSESQTQVMFGTNFTGQVFGANGAGLADAQINVSTLGGVQQPLTATTLSDGTYMYGGLPAGDYKVTFSKGATAVYYSNKTLNQTPDPLHITSGTVTTGVNALLSAWGSVTGFVSLSGTPLPAAGVQITLCDLSLVPIAAVPPVTILADGTTFGAFSMTLIPPGSYQLKFSATGFGTVTKPLTIVAGSTVSNFSAPLTSDTPNVTTFTAPATSSSFTVSGITVIVNSGIGAFSYLITESAVAPLAGDARWSAVSPTSYTVTGGGARTLYAWAKSASGTVSTSKTAVVTVPNPLLTLTFAGTGGGQVNGDLTCVAGQTCTPKLFSATLTDLATLLASPDSNSLFAGWSGPCTVVGNQCKVTVNGPVTVTATFNSIGKLRILGGTTYNQLADGYAAAATSAVLQARSVQFDGDWILNRAISVFFQGGFDSSFSPTALNSVLTSKLLIRSGTLRVDNLVVR